MIIHIDSSFKVEELRHQLDPIGTLRPYGGVYLLEPHDKSAIRLRIESMADAARRCCAACDGTGVNDAPIYLVGATDKGDCPECGS